MSSESGGKYYFVQNYETDKIKTGECELTDPLPTDPWVKGPYDTMCNCCKDNSVNLDGNGQSECRSLGCPLPKPTIKPQPTSTPVQPTTRPVRPTSTPVRPTNNPVPIGKPGSNGNNTLCDKDYTSLDICNSDYTKTIIAMSCLLLVLILLQVASRHFIFPVLQFSAALIILILSALQL